MQPTVTLNGKDVRKIVAKFLGITEEQVIPNRYSYAVTGISVEEIERRINKTSADDEKAHSGLLEDE